VAWIVERKVPNQRHETPSTNPPRMKDLQILQYFSIPEALGDIYVIDGIWCSNVPDCGISSGEDPQVLLEVRDGTGGTGLIFLVTSRSPGIKVRFQDLGSEVVISVTIVWVVSALLRTKSVATHDIEGRKLELPDSMPPFVQWERGR